jgi:oxygen-independent coproporphyrinogen-3 oxidase
MIRSLYVHAPFCARRCFYCDFAVTVAREGDLAGWLGALEGELRALDEEGVFGLAPALDTLFVGGGTPSILGPEAMVGLSRVVGPSRLESPALEWTVEANPESFSREVAEGWARAGVNRISLGAQSFQEAPLRWMGRLHGPEDPALAVARARDAGISNVSLDLIFGLPGEVARDWEAELVCVLALELPHLSLYGLTAEPGTPLGRAVGEGRILPVEENRYRDEFLSASHLLTQAGYRQYEVSNFALPGLESRHNQAYWERQPYLGLGNSAHSFSPPVRRWNLRDWGEYQKATGERRLPIGGEEELSAQQVRLEEIWLGLRTDSGLSTENLSREGQALLRDWMETGWALLNEGRIHLTPEGWLLLDHLAVELDTAVSSPSGPS